MDSQRRADQGERECCEASVPHGNIGSESSLTGTDEEGRSSRGGRKKLVLAREEVGVRGVGVSHGGIIERSQGRAAVGEGRGVVV